MIPKTCPKCKEGEIDYISEVHLIPETKPQEAGYEGICNNCYTHIYIRFKEFVLEMTQFDEFLMEGEKETINL